MQTSEWDHLQTTSKDEGDGDLLQPETQEDGVDRLGVKISLLVLCVGLLLAVIWVISSPSFQKCSALEDGTQRNACYGDLRNELLKPPAKGP
jgi:hypothetical protein